MRSARDRGAGPAGLSCGYFLARLGYQPTWGLEETVTRTMDWYRRMQKGISARNLCLADLQHFEERLAQQPPPLREAAG